jgi:hypothetical protein
MGAQVPFICTWMKYLVRYGQGQHICAPNFDLNPKGAWQGFSSTTSKLHGVAQSSLPQLLGSGYWRALISHNET